MKKRIERGETRTIEQIREHYEIEKELANRLKNAGKEERRHLYTSLYNELYRRVPLHPQLTRKANAKARLYYVSKQVRLLKKFLNPESIFMEIGPGDCSLSIEITKHVRKVYAIDVSEEITKGLNRPDNFELIISDGTSIDVPPKSINVAYSNQLMEHLHPDDARDQLRAIYRALAPIGIYVCVTPNRLSGPHDVSKYFHEVATGFHLKEYTYTELSVLFKQVGFSKLNAMVNLHVLYLMLPLFLIKWCEFLLDKMPCSARRSLAGSLLSRTLLGIMMVAQK